MAKIKEHKFSIAGINYRVNINCTSKGEFSAKIPDDICKPLKLRSRLSGSTLTDVEKQLNEAIDRYKNAETTETVHIAIRYAARDAYSKKANGEPLYDSYNNPFLLALGFSFSDISAIAFDFEVCICETVDGETRWFHSEKGSDVSHIFRNENHDDDKFYRRSQFVGIQYWTKIQYTEKSHETLIQGREAIRKISEILFNFANQEPDQINAALSAGNLLTQ